MEKIEIRLLVAKELLAKAQKEHDAAVAELLLSKKKGLNVDDCNRKEYKARIVLMEAENRLRKAQEAAELENAMTDEEADKLGDFFAGNPSGWETEAEELSEEDEILTDIIANGLDV